MFCPRTIPHADRNALNALQRTSARGGTVIDGTGAAAYRADVGVIGGEIAAIGDLPGASGATTLDVSGLMVAPGFVNIHSHALRNALSAPLNMLRQGVTTEIGNPDGMGVLDVPSWLAGADTMKLALNFGLYAPLNTIWGAVVGNSDRRPSAAQIDSMRALVRNLLDFGAWGVSAALDYTPAIFARTDEVIAILEAARPWRTNFPNHDRVTPENGNSSLAGMRETLLIGERTGVVPVVTHMKVLGRDRGRAEEAIRMIDSVARRCLRRRRCLSISRGSDCPGNDDSRMGPRRRAAGDARAFSRPRHARAHCKRDDGNRAHARRLAGQHLRSGSRQNSRGARE